MTHWIITDTHFGHDKCIEYSGRPKEFATLLLNRLEAVCRTTDILIHLGDVCIGDDAFWHKKLSEVAPFNQWLIRGNHDSKSDSWYLSHGWTCVVDQLRFKKFGADVLFSHRPQADSGYDLNIHGHFHNSNHRRHESELVAVKNDKQLLVMVEHEYRPYSLQKLIEGRSKKSPQEPKTT